MEGKKEKVIENEEGERKKNQIIELKDGEERIDGKNEKSKEVKKKEGKIFEVKRMIGSRYEDKMVKKEKDIVN